VKSVKLQKIVCLVVKIACISCGFLWLSSSVAVCLRDDNGAVPLMMSHEDVPAFIEPGRVCLMPGRHREAKAWSHVLDLHFFDPVLENILLPYRVLGCCPLDCPRLEVVPGLQNEPPIGVDPLTRVGNFSCHELQPGEDSDSELSSASSRASRRSPSPEPRTPLGDHRPGHHSSERGAEPSAAVGP